MTKPQDEKCDDVEDVLCSPCNDMAPFIIRALETPEREDETMMQVDCSDLVMMLVSPSPATASHQLRR